MAVEVEFSKELAQQIRREFKNLFFQAGPIQNQFEIFDPPEQRIIREKVARLVHEPGLRYGGDMERHMIERFERLASDRNWVGAATAYTAAQKFKKIIGYGYTRRRLTPKGDKEMFQFCSQNYEEAKETGQIEREWFWEQMLQGLPMAVMDFKIEVKYLLRKADNTVERLVRLWNVSHQSTPLVVLDPTAFSDPTNFRRWALSQGHFSFGVGERAGITELNMIQHDIARANAKIINEVVTFGWYELEADRTPPGRVGIWFFRDGAILPTGEMVQPDRNGIVWYEDEGYQLSEKGAEQDFTQDVHPRMFPEKSFRDLIQTAHQDGSGLQDTQEVIPAKDADEVDVMRWFFRECSTRLYDTIGGYEGYLVLGSFLAFAAAPEIYGKHGAFPGLWIHGLPGSGKTKVVEWLMNIWGFFGLQKGLELKSGMVTPTGMSIALDQYSNLPVWGDEYRRHQVGEDKLAVVHAAFNRGGHSKYSPGKYQRKVRTAFIVSGESTTDDPATRSRYPLVQVSKPRRLKDHLEWFQDHAHWMFLLGRFILLRRQEFVELSAKGLDDWLRNNKLKGVDQRMRLVYGVPYGAFRALVQMLESHWPNELSGFSDFLAQHTGQSSEDVHSQDNINVFWQDLVTAFEADFLEVDHFYVQEKAMQAPEDAPGQAVGPNGEAFPWTKYTLYINPGPVLSKLHEHKRRQGSALVLSRNDIRDQISKEPYWIPGKQTKRLKGGQGIKKVWAIDIDRHPLGYQPVSDEEFAEWASKPATVRNTEGDPRKGPLFDIIYAWKEKFDSDQGGFV